MGKREKKCSIDGCKRKREVREYCRPCYNRLRRRGIFRRQQLPGVRGADTTGTVLVIGDTHMPFHHQDTFDFLAALAARYRPDQVIHIGDLVDFHALSRHDTDPDGMGAGHELAAARDAVAKLAAMFPRVVVTEGNHDLNLARRAFRYGLPMETVKDLAVLLKTPAGWEFVRDVEIDGVLYSHGTGYGGTYATRRMVLEAQQSVVHGHTHQSGGVIWLSTKRGKALFGAATGCLIDINAYPFAYAKDIKAGVSLGSVVVVDGTPHFHPMKLDSDGRWIGRL